MRLSKIISCFINPFNATIEEPLNGYFLVCYTAVFSVVGKRYWRVRATTATTSWTEIRENKLKKQTKNLNVPHMIFFADFVAVISLLTLSNSMKIGDRCLINSDRRNFDFVGYTYAYGEPVS